jgi:hypothetical protein
MIVEDELTQLSCKKQAGRMKLLLKVLNRFAKTYMPRGRVRFRDDSIWTASGQSDLEKGVIYLSRRQKMNPEAIGLGLTYAYRIGPKYRRMKLGRYEMYFLTLLHEIGHFKIEEKIPKKYVQLKRELEGSSRSVDRGKVIELSYIESKMRRRVSEKERVWKLRLADFMSWLTTGETISHHMRVENWAIDEFEKKRNSIARMLSDAHLTPQF